MRRRTIFVEELCSLNSSAFSDMPKLPRFAADLAPCMEWGLLQHQRNLPPLNGVLRLGLVDDA